MKNKLLSVVVCVVLAMAAFAVVLFGARQEDIIGMIKRLHGG